MIIISAKLAKKLVIEYDWIPYVDENNFAKYQRPRTFDGYSLDAAFKVVIEDLIKE